MSEQNPKHLTLEEFLRYFREQKSARFCFILGAGASKSSGIPTGEELAPKWFREIMEDMNNEEFRSWIEELAPEWFIEINEEMDDEKFRSWIRDNKITGNELSRFYPQIFATRFRIHAQYGHDVLEEEIEKGEPSIGYAFLSKILAEGKHNVVITTNFDSLIEDALFIHTSKKPLVIGHSGLASYISAHSQRVQIIKVHHDLFLSPKNIEDDTKQIPKDLEDGLREIFRIYTPIVIGYAGNDGGFMGTLRKVLEKRNGICWCLRSGDVPKSEIIELINEKNGCFVSIEDFDELMMSIGNEIELNLEHGKIIKIAQERANRYDHQILTIHMKTKDRKSSFPRYLDEIFEREMQEKPTWLYYWIKAEKEPDIAKRELIYKRGLEEFPDSHQLMGNYADFLSDIRKDHEQAEFYYHKALRLESDDSFINRTYATFLRTIRKDFEQAEFYYQKALQLEPDNPFVNLDYADFLRDDKKDSERAEFYYQKALQLEPDNSIINLDYAIFLEYFKKDNAQAEFYYQKALQLEPDNSFINITYANFLRDRGKDFERAELYYQKALQLKKDEPYNNGNYALLLILQENFDKAAHHINKSFEYIQDDDEKDLVLNLWFYRYACFYNDYPESKGEIEKLLEGGVRSPGWPLDGLLETVKKLGHPEYEQVVSFAKQISEIK